MKEKLLISITRLFKFCSPKSFGFLLTLFLLLNFAAVVKTNAQTCVGPYARFESSFLNTVPTGFTYTGATLFTNPNSANSRSGGSLFQHSATNADATIVLPIINYPKLVSFYVRKSAAAGVQMSCNLQFSTDNGTTWFAVLPGTNTVNGISYTGVTPTLTTATGLSAWDLVSVTFNSNVPSCKIRLADTRAVGVAGVLWFDDISWICNKSDGTASTGYPENTIVVPAQTGVGVPTNCAGGTITVDPTAVYNFYDNGGASDAYNINQTNQVTFKPSALGFAAGDRIRIQFMSYLFAAGDQVSIWDNDGTTLDAATNLYTGELPITTYVSTISADGSITVMFNSDGLTNKTGFNIKVDCIRCSPPTALATATAGATSGSLTWTSGGPTTYDLYYNTTGVLPTGYITPSVSNIATNSYTLTGLATSQTYYVWVRSRCGTAPDSYSTWTSSVSFTTTDCSAFVLASSPSGAAQNLCLNATAATLTASASGGTVSTYQWYSNTTSSTTGGTAVGTNSSSYTPLTTAAGTLYYYCVITSAIACTVTTTVSGSVTVTAPPAIAPVATAGSGAASLSFTANWGAVAGATAYYLDVSTVNTFASFVAGYNNLAVGNVLTYGVTGLTPGVTYYYRVRAYNICGATASSNSITQATVGVTYCVPNASTNTDHYIDSFATTGGVTNITNNSTGFTAGGYANYAGTLSCSQYPTASVGFTITNKNTTSTYYYYLWIDWNSDGDFDDAGETLYNTTANGYAVGPFTGSFTIPALQAAGAYRMRVANSYIGANTSCTNNNYGEFEDYTINVLPVPPCTVSLPSAIAASNISGTSATLTWVDAAQAPSSVYNYYYNTTGVAPVGATVPNGSVTGVNTVNLTGLTLGSTYSCWVRTNCSGTYSAWTGPVTFTTVDLDIINLNTSGSITTCNARFYDSGGSTANYTDNENYTYTFTPTAGSTLKAVFNSFNTENNWDGLVIYNGNSTAAPMISSGLAAGTGSPANCPAGSYYGTTSPGTVYSTAVDGSLTFQFRSDGSILKAGWDATITCVTLPTITSFTPDSACAGVTPAVTLTGTNFTGITSVKFNGVAAVYTVVNSTTITTTLPTTATTGIITVSNAQATGSSTTSFVVNPIPTGTNAGSDVVICGGTSTNLAGTVTGAVTSTVWSPATNLSSTTVLTPVANPTSTTTYTLTTTNAAGCTASDQVTITVNPKPTVSIPTASANICANTVVPVTATGTAATYTWSSSVANTLFTDATGTTAYVAGASTTNIYVKTATTATITVMGTNALGCLDAATVTFTVSTKTYNNGFWNPAGPPINDGTENLVFIAGPYISSGNLSACSCTVSGATVTFNDGHTLTLQNGLTVSSGSMTFNSGASLVQINNVVNVGNITYKRNSTPCFQYDYTYWSTPVSPQTLFNVSPNTSANGLYQYDSSLPGWQNLPGTAAMSPGRGYIIRVPDDGTFPLAASLSTPVVYTASFVGVPNNGVYTRPIIGGANQLNLLGNPYPSAMSASALVSASANLTALDGTLYFWTHNTTLNAAFQYVGTDYALWNSLGGVSAAATNIGVNNAVPNGYIAGGQGFFVKGLASGTVTFNNSMRVSGNNAQFYRSASVVSSSTFDALEKSRVWLNITNQDGDFKNVLLGYVTGGTEGIDRDFDGEMVDIDKPVTLYTKVGDVKLTIQGKGLPFSVADTFDLCYKSQVVGSCTISITDIDGLFITQNIYLEDKLLNVIHDLKDSAYTFTTAIGTFEDRFSLRFTTEALSTPSFNEQNVVVYKNTSGVYIATGSVPMKSVAIYDVTGRLIIAKNDINATETSFVTLPNTQQVLLVKVTSETGVTITKKIIY